MMDATRILDRLHNLGDEALTEAPLVIAALLIFLLFLSRWPLGGKSGPLGASLVRCNIRQSPGPDCVRNHRHGRGPGSSLDCTATDAVC